VSEGLVVIRGAGDLGTGVAIRLWRSGFDVVMLESSAPLAVRRTVAFSEAVYEGESCVEGVRGVLVKSTDGVMPEIESQGVPVLVDPGATSLTLNRGPISPFALVDATLAKRNLGTSIDMADVVIGLGPGFTAGHDVKAVVETNRGPDLGRIIWEGSGEPNTGVPAAVMGRAQDRVVRSPVAGTVRNLLQIGDFVEQGQTICMVDGQPVVAAFRSLVRGLIRDGTGVPAGLKIGDIDPRLDRSLCFRVSDKSLAIAGGVLEAILSYRSGRLAR
jgi:xanthine dehydrogenase accessory factor